MRLKKIQLIFFIIGLWVCQGCNEEKQMTPPDTPASGEIKISVDESFRPVMEEEINAYIASNPGAKFNVSYLPEAECLKDLYYDSTTRMVIVTKGLKKNEEDFLKQKLGYDPSWNLVALDAIAIMVNSKSSDTMFTLASLKQLLSGKLKSGKKIVFDGLSATSTLRFIQDSVMKGEALDTSVVKAADGSQAVLDFVADNANAIGLVGISWIGNPEDTAQVNRLKKIRMAYVKCEWCTDSPYVRPGQESINNKRYPLVRGLYYVLKENYYGLGNGFADFLKYERGQLIIRRAYLGPVMNFDTRNIRINQKLPKN
ncbi:MAG: substrate-binding domain-containing protein [Ferruginibacter sp.]